MPVKIKFCGITRAIDADAAVALGVDALGFVFYADSPRYVEPSTARAIIRRLPPFICTVGLFVNADADSVARIADTAGVALVQYHGDESPTRCAAGPWPWIKALRVRAGMDVAAECARFEGASALLFDSYDRTVYGGSGAAFDWTLIPPERHCPAIVAGGLNVDNVAAAILATAPYAVDVSGGIESAKGIKDHDKMKKFVAEVKRVDSQA